MGQIELAEQVRRSMTSAVFFVLVLASALLPPTPASAQLDVEAREGLRVYFDCSGPNCNSSYYRTEIAWVNWVRDRTLAQVHLIMTSQGTASGGREYRFDFIGLEDLADSDDQLTYTSLGTDTQEERLSGISRVLAVGLARYSVLAGFGEGLEVARSGDTRDLGTLVSGDEVDDPWNFWIFEIGANGNYNSESTQSFFRLGGNFSASRTTTDWRFVYRANGSYTRNSFELSDGEEFIDERTNWSTSSELVHAVADHWSIGVEVRANRSTRFNQDLGFDVLPAIEYSVWPYEESPRRSLRAFYEIGVRYFDWEKETIFGKLSEVRPGHALEVSLFQRQQWGQTGVSVDLSSFLDDFSQNRIEFGGHVSIRVFRGLRWNMSGSIERIRDQLFSPAEGLTDEEILLRRVAQQSDLDWRLSMGFSYEFGSIFNNVVFNRF